MEDALNLYEPVESKKIHPMPLKLKLDASNIFHENNLKKRIAIVRVKVRSSVAFAMLIRQTRLKRNYTLQKMASLLGYKNINTYVKLEKPKTANPELKTLEKIKRCFADFPIGQIF